MYPFTVVQSWSEYLTVVGAWQDIFGAGGDKPVKCMSMRVCLFQKSPVTQLVWTCQIWTWSPRKEYWGCVSVRAVVLMTVLAELSHPSLFLAAESVLKNSQLNLWVRRTPKSRGSGSIYRRHLMYLPYQRMLDLHPKSLHSLPISQIFGNIFVWVWIAGWGWYLFHGIRAPDPQAVWHQTP